MTVGDILTLKPTIDTAAGFARPESMPCRVIYIHPERRFFVVEFRSDVTGQTWRETFYFRRQPERVAQPPRFGVKRRKAC